MKEVTIESLKKYASKLMFTLADDEYAQLLEEFKCLFVEMDEINLIDGLDEAEPMVFPFEVTTDFLREDEEGEVLSVEEVLKNAKDVQDGQIKLPKVVG